MRPMLALANMLRPFSLRKLIVFGFLFSVLPLVTAMVATVLAVEELATLSQATAYRVAQISRKNEMLREGLVDFERKGKRYLVLEDAESRLALENAHQELDEVLNGLRTLMEQPGDLSAGLAGLSDEAETIFHRIVDQSGRSAARPGTAARRPAGQGDGNPDLVRVDQASQWFSGLSGKAREFSGAVSILLDAEVEHLEEESLILQQRILAQSSILLPVSVALISLLIFLIIRSVRQMDRAIRRLGAGDLVRPIQVSGPKDLEYLGERLDWLRTRLHSLEESKAQFIRHVSHDLKTPLANLHEGTGLLADEVVGELNTEQREIVDILLANAHKLDALIADLINYSQVSARPGAARRENVDMQGLVRAVIDDAQIRLRAKSISVRERLRPVRIEGNPEQMRTIVDNLLSNAIKYSPQEGEIGIAVGQSGGHMVLEIEDDGPGIDPQEREQVFEPFFQGRAAREGRVEGTGLGLAIVSECVAAHHGKVEALEPGPGKTGARIRLQLPLKQDD